MPRYAANGIPQMYEGSLDFFTADFFPAEVFDANGHLINRWAFYIDTDTGIVISRVKEENDQFKQWSDNYLGSGGLVELVELFKAPLRVEKRVHSAEEYRQLYPIAQPITRIPDEPHVVESKS